MRDPLHGEVHVPDELMPLLEHPLFQRLRRIRQLAFVSLVYPGACHTRFLHSLGVMHISARAGGDEALLAYALIHDVGHFPFSHAMEIALRRNGINMMHEDLLEERAREILEDSVFSVREVVKHPLRPLVDGGVGTDRLDYLARDSYFTGVPVGNIPWDRIVRNVRVEGDRLVVAEKVLPNVEHVFIARFMLGDAVYFHKTVLIANEMFAKAVGELLEHYSAKELVRMDDFQLVAALRDVGSTWWKRLEARRLFKLVYRGDEEGAREVYERFAAEKGEEKVLLGRREHWYKDPHVVLPDGTPVEVASPLIGSLREAEARRLYWFVAVER